MRSFSMLSSLLSSKVLLPLILLITAASATPFPARKAYDEAKWVRSGKRALIQPNFASRNAKTVRGVNLGGWFVLEAWMAPDFFTPDLQNRGAIDQWTFMTAVNNDARARSLLQQHWSSWITERDFQAMQAAGLNTVRIPVGHWTFAPSSSEPYLAGAELNYIAQAIKWAGQYGLDVLLDLHTAPGSQNGFDNSGHQGPIQFKSVNGAQNAARVYAALQDMVRRFVNDNSYGGAVKAIEVLNEPACYSLGQSYMTDIHKAAYAAIRNTVSSSALVYPTVVLHDCFVQPLSSWYSTYGDANTWVPGSYAVDTHRYTSFAPVAGQLGESYPNHINYICSLQGEMSDAQSHFPTFTGEWSLAVACSGCTYYTMDESVASQNNRTQNLFYRQFYEAQVMTYEQAGGWVFWNWKTQAAATWSYEAGLAQGWIPQDPTTRVFKQRNNCPTAELAQDVTFATQSDSTTTGRRDVNSLLDSEPLNAPLVHTDNAGTLSGVLQQIIPKIAPVAQKVINSNAFPFIAKTTFGQGIWH